MPPRFKVAPVVSRLRIELKRPVLKACAAPATEAQAYNPSSKAETSNVVVHDVKEAEHGAPGAAVSESLDVIPDASAAAGTSPAVPAQAAEVLEPLVSQVKAEDSGAFEGSASMVESVAVAHPAVLKDEGEGKQPVIEEREGGILPKMSEPPSHKEAEGVAVESEVSKGVFRASRIGSSFCRLVFIRVKISMSCAVHDVVGIPHIETSICLKPNMPHFLFGFAVQKRRLHLISVLRLLLMLYC